METARATCQCLWETCEVVALLTSKQPDQRSLEVCGVQVFLSRCDQPPGVTNGANLSSNGSLLEKLLTLSGGDNGNTLKRMRGDTRLIYWTAEQVKSVRMSYCKERERVPSTEQWEQKACVRCVCPHTHYDLFTCFVVVCDAWLSQATSGLSWIFR